MRTPSSSSSRSQHECLALQKSVPGIQLTDVDRFDSDAFLNMGRLGIISNLVAKDFGLAERVHESGATRSRGT